MGGRSGKYGIVRRRVRGSKPIRVGSMGKGSLRGRSEAADRAETEICSRSLSTMLFINIS